MTLENMGIIEHCIYTNLLAYLYTALPEVIYPLLNLKVVYAGRRKFTLFKYQEKYTAR